MNESSFSVEVDKKIFWFEKMNPNFTRVREIRNSMEWSCNLPVEGISGLACFVRSKAYKFSSWKEDMERRGRCRDNGVVWFWETRENNFGPFIRVYRTGGKENAQSSLCFPAGANGIFWKIIADHLDLTLPFSQKSKTIILRRLNSKGSLFQPDQVKSSIQSQPPVPTHIPETIYSHNTNVSSLSTAKTSPNHPHHSHLNTSQAKPKTLSSSTSVNKPGIICFPIANACKVQSISHQPKLHSTSYKSALLQQRPPIITYRETSKTIISENHHCSDMALTPNGTISWEDTVLVETTYAVDDWGSVEDLVRGILKTGEVSLIPFNRVRAVIKTKYNTKPLLDLGEIYMSQVERLFFRRWHPDCNQVNLSMCKVNVKIFGLPFNLWNEEVFHDIGETFGDFLMIDEDTKNFKRQREGRRSKKNQIIPVTLGPLSSVVLKVGMSFQGVRRLQRESPSLTKQKVLQSTIGSNEVDCLLLMSMFL